MRARARTPATGSANLRQVLAGTVNQRSSPVHQGEDGMALAGITAAVEGGKLTGWLIGLAATIGVGFATAEVYEHKVPWGLGPQLSRLHSSLPARDAQNQKTGADAQLKSDQTTLTQWQASLAECRSGQTSASTSTAAQLDAALSIAKKSQSAAYELGRATCKGPTDAKTPPAGSVLPGAGVLPGDTDLGAALAVSAYAPARH